MYGAQQNALGIILRHVRCECSSKSWSSAVDRQAADRQIQFDIISNSSLEF